MADHTLIEPIVQVRTAWSDDWAAVPWLRAVQATRAMMPTTDQATFLWRYGNILRPGAQEQELVTPADLDRRFVRILQPADPPSEPAELWVGQIVRTSDSPGGASVAAAGTGEQRITAIGLEGLLRESPVDGSYCLIDGEGGRLMGNRSAYPTGGSYVFSDEGHLWTGRDVLEYLILRFGPAVPAFGLAGGDVLANLEHYIDVWACPRDVSAGISMIVRRTRGHGWRVAMAGGVPTVTVVSAFSQEITAGGMIIVPNSDPVDLDADAAGAILSALSIGQESAHRFDRITVYGNHLWLAGSLGYDRAWSDDAQIAYNDLDDEGRKRDLYDQVYRAFKGKTIDGAIFRDGAGEPAANPVVDDDGQIDFESAGPMLTLGRSLTRQTPLRVGYDYSTGVEVLSDGGATGEFRPMAVYLRWTLDETERWTLADRIGEIYGGTENEGEEDEAPLPPSSSFHVAPMAGNLGFTVRGAYNHLLGADHFSGTSDHEALYDWDEMLVTAALHSDQRLRVTRLLNESAPSPRHLVVEVPDAECWIILRGAVVGQAPDDSLQRLAANLVLRNDRARLLIVLALAEAWYGRSRRAVTAAWKRILTDYLPGQLLRTVFARGQYHDSNSLITSVTWDWVDHATTVETDFAELDLVGVLGRNRRTGSGSPTITAAIAGASADGLPASVRPPNVAARLAEPPPNLPPIPDTAKDWVLAFDSALGYVRWVETKPCP